jgi:N-acetylneuraminate synthase
MDRMVTIGGRAVGDGQSCLVIAEAGVNHNGEVGQALRLVEAAAAAGADAVKFQTFRAELLATTDAPKAAYQTRATGAGESQRAMLKRLELGAEDHRRLAEACAARGMLFLSTPFDEDSADFLESLGVPAFKLPSGELTNLGLLAHVARKGRPMIISTGMATMAEVRSAVEAVRATGNKDLVLLHCVSSYPARPEDANLRAMDSLREAFGVPVGFSDHTPGIEVALAAAALGACIIEKHLTLDRALPGPDHQASIEPHEMAELVHGVRTVCAALGDGRKAPRAAEQELAAAARRSLVAARRIPAGETLTEETIALRRPGTGLPPAALAKVVGRHARREIAEGTVLTWDMVQ